MQGFSESDRRGVFRRGFSAHLPQKSYISSSCDHEAIRTLGNRLRQHAMQDNRQSYLVETTAALRLSAIVHLFGRVKIALSRTAFAVSIFRLFELQ